MLVDNVHLCYCTNIHAGKNWTEDFAALKKYFPLVKQQVSPNSQMAIGLRVSNEASKSLVDDTLMVEFKEWLSEVGGYIFTLNGFPYGDFHHTSVKEDVHTPDWVLVERKNYTLRLFKILSELLPDGLDGGISTSPLTYRHWYLNGLLKEAKKKATENIVAVILQLIELTAATGKMLHLDIEPEPDGLIESGQEFIEWFEDILQPIAIPAIMEKFAVAYNLADTLLKEHLRICYDVCHFAISYENHQDVINELLSRNIKIGKIQISSALKAVLPVETNKRKDLVKVFSPFNESTYLHQVIARKADNELIRYRDLPYALLDFENPAINEWRAHFHIPISDDLEGIIQSTQDDIVEVLNINKRNKLTQYLEVETYTWEVLPRELKIPLENSISNELLWVIDKL